MRTSHCIIRSFSPKRLILFVVASTLIYVMLLRNSTLNDERRIAATEEQVRSVDVVQQSKNIGVAEREHDIKDPVELEIARQTLTFLNMEDAVTKPKPHVKIAQEDGSCPAVERIPDLQGALPQATLLIQNLQEGEVHAVHPELGPGGSWKPNDCQARDKIAVIIPYRDRQTHLTRLIDFLIPILQRQRLDFRFIVTEQYGNDLFNKGRIMNAAFIFVESLGVDCVVFHDVDMFPQDDRNPYSCPPGPRHLGAFVSNLGYQLWYKEIVGGVLAVSMADYRAVNGYSNQFWAWGGEDDDMGQRILSLNYTIERPNPETGRYSMLKHVKRKRTAPKLIYKLLGNSANRVAYDGLNETDKWTIRKVTTRPLYYHLYVDVGPVPEEWRAKA
ncbi:hypothetical protein L3Y34_018206 [Caenorhabditis briggsae]|uniref:Beta-1,4-N-acetylgalactosaminyltransferase n=2 Tax=Caenorhabditis briggsae TaxID=6238 RepID=A0AAE9DJU4_CAEBR|nr:hypothetical protein L3Y34_018206 [Caenorhabditis briggsae]